MPSKKQQQEYAIFQLAEAYAEFKIKQDRKSLDRALMFQDKLQELGLKPMLLSKFFDYKVKENAE